MLKTQEHHVEIVCGVTLSLHFSANCVMRLLKAGEKGCRDGITCAALLEQCHLFTSAIPTSNYLSKNICLCASS